MEHIHLLKQIADMLDTKGFIKQANTIDKYLISIAQNAPATDPTLGTTPAPAEQASSMMQPPALAPASVPKIDPKKENEKLARTNFLMFDELRDFYSKNLPKFSYFGEDNINTLQAAIDQLFAIYRVTLRSIAKEYNHNALSAYEAHIVQLQQEVDRSTKMKLTPAKVKIDKFLLYDELDMMMKKIERNHDQGIAELQPVLKKIRSVRDAFANIIKQTSEQIAHSDLIETQ